jgi:hypothetical protein
MFWNRRRTRKIGILTETRITVNGLLFSYEIPAVYSRPIMHFVLVNIRILLPHSISSGIVIKTWLHGSLNADNQVLVPLTAQGRRKPVRSTQQTKLSTHLHARHRFARKQYERRTIWKENGYVHKPNIFTDTISYSDCVVPIGGMIVDWETSGVNYYHEIYAEGLRKNLSQYSRFPGRDLNRALHQYMSELQQIFLRKC